MNNVTIIGRLVRDPELRYIPSTGNAIANFTLAVDKGLSRDKKQEMESRNQPTADFIDIVVWGKMGENCANYLKQGLQVAIQGRIQTGSYEDKQGVRRKTFDVVASNVEFLEWGDKQNNQQSYGQQRQPNNNFNNIDGFHPVDNEDIPF